MKIIPWTTSLSRVEALYFDELRDQGEVCFVVQDKDGVSYEVLLPNDGSPYLVSDEEYLIRYTKLEGGGQYQATFEIEDSDFIECIVKGTHLEGRGLRHFVVVTFDGCFEAFSATEPIVRRVEEKE